MKYSTIAIIGFSLILLASLSLPVFSQAPSGDRNYVIETTVRVSGQTDISQLPSLGVSQANRTINYFDGLGRPLQTIGWKASPDQGDVVSPRAYDALGRERFRYEPYVQFGGNGAYRPAALTTEQAGYYQGLPFGGSIPSSSYPFSETEFEASPLNRPLRQGSAGADWQLSGGHVGRMSYGANVAAEVRQWTVGADGASSIKDYDAGTLFKTVSMDENWTSGHEHSSEEFRDLQGRVVLKRTWLDENHSLSTYYLYDDLGNLRYVLPPAVNENGKAGYSPTLSFTESSVAFTDFMYGYHYDGRRRLTKKQVAGKDWEYMIYDRLDRVVLTQDVKLRALQQWVFSKYDAFDRVVQTGIYNDGSSPVALQNSLMQPGSALWESRDDGNWTGYSNNAFPQSGILSYLSMSYYGNYGFSGNAGLPTAQESTEGGTRTLLTGSRLQDLSSGVMLVSTNYYDSHGRMVRSVSGNAVGGSDVVSSSWNFDGSLDHGTRVHTGHGLSTTIANHYEYDHQGRKTKSWQKTFSSPQTDAADVLLSELVYDDLGRVRERKLHNGIQQTQLAYNERGWLKRSNSTEFSMELFYQEDGMGAARQWNGNISGQSFTNGGSNSFTYLYDKLGRLQQASASGLGELIEYDVMGNITKMTRDNYGVNDYTGYSGNRLTAVSGFSAGSFSYDANGNQLTDSHRGINTPIVYNMLNLPVSIADKGLGYAYDASGVKLRKTNQIGTTDYSGGIQYVNGALELVQTEVGIARPSGGSFIYEYNLTDHLGNVRASFLQDPITQQVSVFQRDDYYAFGLRKEGVPNSNLNKYLYNGKELQEELNQFDYGARFYDPVIARWNVIDPKAEQGRRWSPYNYTFNNPIKFRDPDGMWPDPPEWMIKARDAMFRLLGGKTDQQQQQNVNRSERDNKIVELGSKIEDVKTVGKAIKPAAKIMARKSAPALQKTGTVVTAVGFGAAPFTEGTSLALVPVGQGIEKTGTAIQFGFDLHDGKYKDAGFTVVTEVAFGALGKTIDKAADAGKITKTDQGVLNFFSEAWGKVTDLFYDKSKDEK